MITTMRGRVLRSARAAGAGLLLAAAGAVVGSAAPSLAVVLPAGESSISAVSVVVGGRALQYRADTVLLKTRTAGDAAAVVDGVVQGLKRTVDGDLAQGLVRDLLDWGVIAAEPVFAGPFADPALAAEIGLDRHVVLTVRAGVDVTRLAADLRQHTRVFETVELDELGVLTNVPNDPLFVQQWHLNNTGQTVGSQAGTAGTDIDAVAAWSRFGAELSATSAIVRVAILDTGISKSHPDLTGVTVGGSNFTNTDTTAWDDSTQVSHGTYCAGIAGAQANNGLGVTGASPNVRLLAGKVVQAALASQTWCSRGLRWAADSGAKIASMSLQWGTEQTAMRDACTYASGLGVLMFASTGNSFPTAIGFPAANPLVIGVGATDNRDMRFVGSQTGTQVDLVMPGVGIYTTVDEPNGSNGPIPDGYVYQTGTSMACPMAAGVAAMIWGLNPALTPEEVKSILLSTTNDLGEPGWDAEFGHGRGNAYRAAYTAYYTARCRGDVDGSGAASTEDVFAFLAYWFQGDLRGDANGDGLLTVEDTYTFLSSWFTGCTP